MVQVSLYLKMHQETAVVVLLLMEQQPKPLCHTSSAPSSLRS